MEQALFYELLPEYRGMKRARKRASRVSTGKTKVQVAEAGSRAPCTREIKGRKIGELFKVPARSLDPRNRPEGRNGSAIARETGGEGKFIRFFPRYLSFFARLPFLSLRILTFFSPGINM